MALAYGFVKPKPRKAKPKPWLPGQAKASTALTGTGSTPASVVINVQTFNSDSNWPKDLILNHAKGNWQEWDQCLRLVVDQRGFHPYLNGTLPCPDATLHPTAAYNWATSDIALRGFILEHVSDHDYNIANIHDDSHGVYSTLRDSHQNQGPFAKIKLFKEILSTDFVPDIPLTCTFDKIRKLHSRLIKMGRLGDDELLSMFVLNGLRNHFPRLQTSINDMMMNPSNSSTDVRARLLQEEQTNLTEISSENTAHAAISSKPPRPVCSNCKCPGHRADFCISPGGLMAGKTIEEARAAQEAARSVHRNATNRVRPSQNPSNTANTASVQTAPSNDNPQTFTFNGKSYMLINDSTPAATQADSANISMPPYNEDKYHAFIGATEEARVSIDWTTHTQQANPSSPPDCAYTGRYPTARLDELPFILDTGATVHISPESSDFKVLRSIPPRPVKGLCGSAQAIGIGEIELRIAGGHTLKLTDVLYIPECTVRLISILALNRSAYYTSCFDPHGCWIQTEAAPSLSVVQLLNQSVSISSPLPHRSSKDSNPLLTPYRPHLSHVSQASKRGTVAWAIATPVP